MMKPAIITAAAHGSKIVVRQDPCLIVCHAWMTPDMKKRTMKTIGAALFGA
jgi:hypothetical protein